MKKIRLNQLKGDVGGTVFGDLVAGRKVTKGGIHVFKPGEVAHANQERHVHDDVEEIFIVLQGKGRLPVEEEVHDAKTGDVIIIEPGENHHMGSSEEDPLVIVWLHIE